MKKENVTNRADEVIEEAMEDGDKHYRLKAAIHIDKKYTVIKQEILQKSVGVVLHKHLKEDDHKDVTQFIKELVNGKESN